MRELKVILDTTTLPLRYHPRERIEEILDAIPAAPAKWTCLNLNDIKQVHVLRKTPGWPDSHVLRMNCGCRPRYAGDSDYPIVIHRYED